jgi:hypothetical protein
MDKRRHARKSCDLDACLSSDNLMMVGRVLDCSEGGMFFQPYMIQDETPITFMSTLSTIKEDVTITLSMSGTKLPFNTKWTGYSHTHHAYGIGVGNMV